MNTVNRIADRLAAACIHLSCSRLGLAGQIVLGGLALVLLPAAIAGLLAPAGLALIISTGLGLAGLVAGGIWATRRLAQPLQALAQAALALDASPATRPSSDTAPPPAPTRNDEIGDLVCALAQVRNAGTAQHAQTHALAYRDRLTGLPNRARFCESVQQAIDDAGPGGAPLAVLTLDLDRFRHINEVLGSRFGDHALVAVAQRLEQAVREGDVVARLGGDEFALLLPNTEPAVAERLAQRIAHALEQPLTIAGHTVDLSAGLGLATWPLHADDGETLLSRAEMAMVAAKRRRTGIQVYDPADESASALNLSLLGELRQALSRNELRIVLQPKITIDSGAVNGAEALMRWQHPSRGLLQPQQFIPFAEQTGFIRQLTLWIFDQAARLQVALALLGVRRVSVNLSARDLADPELPEKLDAILRLHGAVAEGFCLEITESAIMDDPARAEATLNHLCERGFKLSIDDYGAGFSSLAHLQRLPVNELKIDQRFVMAMERAPGDALIVQSTIALAHALGLSVVAEGVENSAVLSQLQAMGCDEGQGFHMSPPLPVDEFQDWVARWQAVPPSPIGLMTPPQHGASLVH